MSYLSFSSWIFKGILERISLDLLCYLKRHKFDVCNSFVGTNPSIFVQNNLIPLDEWMKDRSELVSVTTKLVESFDRWNVYFDLNDHEKLKSEMTLFQSAWNVDRVFLPIGTLVCVSPNGLDESSRSFFQYLEWDSVNGAEYIYGRLVHTVDRGIPSQKISVYCGRDTVFCLLLFFF
jgi:hypothetical protein